MTTANKVTITASQQVNHVKYAPTSLSISYEVELPDDPEQAALLVNDETIAVQVATYHALGLPYMIEGPDDDGLRVVKLIAEEFPGTVVVPETGDGAGNSRSSGRGGSGGSRTSGRGGSRSSSSGRQSGGRTSGRGGSGSRGRSGGGGNYDAAKSKAAEEIISIWEEGGAVSLKNEGVIFFEGKDGKPDCVRAQGWADDGKDYFINADLLGADGDTILDELAALN